MYNVDRLAKADRSEVVSDPLSDRSSVRILVVDDDMVVKELLVTSLMAHGYSVVGTCSPEHALSLMRTETFDMLLTDVRMPGIDGLEILHRVHMVAPEVPVILITAVADVDVVRRALSDGACDFITKPFSIGDLPVIVERNLTRHALTCRRTYIHRQQLLMSYEAVLDALLSALDTRNTETEGHSERVTAYTMLLADSMCVQKNALYVIERGALLHDIGKIGIPDRILLKPGPLNELEWAEMKEHPQVGYRMCSRIDFLSEAATMVLQHHERWDGGGYPSGLRREDIHLGARIFAVVDALDAMTTDRPYRQAIAFPAARAEIAACSRTQFDPTVVDCFLRVPTERWEDLRRQMMP